MTAYPAPIKNTGGGALACRAEAEAGCLTNASVKGRTRKTCRVDRGDAVLQGRKARTSAADQSKIIKVKIQSTNAETSAFCQEKRQREYFRFAQATILLQFKLEREALCGGPAIDDR
jgi:translation elongation factor EF-Tu-like GTPase